MNIQTVVLTAGVLIMGLGCGHPGSVGTGGGGGARPEVVAQPKRFTQLVDGFSSLLDCQGATQGSVFNCEHELLLCPNGGFTLMLTDIMNEGRYTQQGQQVDGALEGSGDAPGRFTATLAQDGSTFTSPQLPGSHPWNRQLLSGAALTQAQDTCAAMEGRFWW